MLLSLDNSVSLAEKFDALIPAEPEQAMLLPNTQTAQIIQLTPQDGLAMYGTIVWHAMHNVDHWILIGVMSTVSWDIHRQMTSFPCVRPDADLLEGTLPCFSFSLLAVMPGSGKST